MAATPTVTTRLVKLFEVQRFIVDVMMKVGVPEGHAIIMADVLTHADRRGVFSQGISLLDMYVNDLQRKTWNGAAKPSILKETAATAWVDGNNGLGSVVGKFSMQLAIRKASETGFGWVVAKGSNHYGIAGCYSTMALKEKMIGMSFSNTSPLSTPTRSRKTALGSNPLSVAAPAVAGEAFVLDMATTVAAMGKIEVKRRRLESIPHGWAQDEHGFITTDAEEAMRACCLMPLGGEEATSGYKGYGLALMVEVFCGVLAGGPCGPEIRPWLSDEHHPFNLSHSFVALNTKCFAPGFRDRLQDLMYKLRGLEPADKGLSVLVAGDPERAHEKIAEQLGGVRYHLSLIEASDKLAKRLGVRQMESQ